MRRVLVLVLEAAPPELIEKWTDDGSLPNLKHLREIGAYGRLDSVEEWLADSTPYALFSGQNPAATGLHCHTMWQKETMKARAPGKDWLPYQPFWRSFRAPGPRAVVLDASDVYAPEPFNGIEVIGWATHDTLAPFQSYPPAVASWIDHHFGSALMRDEMYGPAGKRDFLRERESLIKINRKFKDLCLALMQREQWDLFLASNATSQQAGHRLWSPVNVTDHLSVSEYDELADSLRQVYIACDEAVGALAHAAGPDAVVLILSGHGMQANTSRNSVFPEMLGRVLRGRLPGRGALQRARQLVPLEWRHAVKSNLPYSWRRALTRYWRIKDYRWQETRAFALFSDSQGWVRINLRGREAQGIVEPGADYEDLCQEISDGLRTFVDADTAAPVVKDIIRLDQVFEGKRIADLPDLIVRWADTPSARHRAVTSPSFGTIPWPTPGRNPEGRSGNHSPQGMLIAAGPGIKAGALEKAHILDLAPTILTLLDQPVPAVMEGKSLNLRH